MTTSHDLAPDPADLIASRTQVSHPRTSDEVAAAVGAMLDREALRDLALLYTRVLDDYDVDAVVDLFTQDGSFIRRGMTSTGPDELRAAYESPAERFRFMIHRVDAHVVDLTGPDTAVGWVAGYTELATADHVVSGVFRYDDHYRRDEGRWKFTSREVSFLYIGTLDNMTPALTSDQRIQWPGTEPLTGHFPENSAAWRARKA